MSADTANSNDRHSNGRFANGNPGGPGRPRNLTHYDYMRVLDAYAQQASAEIIKVVIQQALAGNLKAADLLLKRQWPLRKGRPVRFGIRQGENDERTDAIEKFMPHLDEAAFCDLKGEFPAADDVVPPEIEENGQ